MTLSYLTQIRYTEYKANRIENVRFSSAVQSSNRRKLFVEAIDFGPFTVRFETIQYQLFYVHVASFCSLFRFVLVRFHSQMMFFGAIDLPATSKW